MWKHLIRIAIFIHSKNVTDKCLQSCLCYWKSILLMWSCWVAWQQSLLTNRKDSLLCWTYAFQSRGSTVGRLLSLTVWKILFWTYTVVAEVRALNQERRYVNHLSTASEEIRQHPLQGESTACRWLSWDSISSVLVNIFPIPRFLCRNEILESFVFLQYVKTMKLVKSHTSILSIWTLFEPIWRCLLSSICHMNIYT